MDLTLTTQQELRSVIQDVTIAINETTAEEWSEGSVQSHLEILDAYWSDFQANHMMLLQSEVPQDHPYFTERDYPNAERNYIVARGRLYDARSRLQAPRLISSTPLPTAEQPRGATRLPRITIPQFSGNRSDWESFRDMFLSLVHNDPSLSDVDKLYYLKTQVLGKVKTALDNLQVTGANYLTGWSTLEARYDHRRLLVQDHLKALRSLRPLKDESSVSLQHLLDGLNMHRDQLRALGRSVDGWDD